MLPERTWETRSEVAVADPGHEFAFIVNGSWTRWGYAFAPVEGGTELTESWEFLPGGIAMFEERFGADAQAQIANRLELAKKGIPATLAAIKKDAEAGRQLKTTLCRPSGSTVIPSFVRGRSGTAGRCLMAAAARPTRCRSVSGALTDSSQLCFLDRCMRQSTSQSRTPRS